VGLGVLCVKIKINMKMEMEMEMSFFDTISRRSKFVSS